MKKRLAAIIIFLSIFLALFLGAFFLVRPIFDKIEAVFENADTELQAALASETGTAFRYKTISPSLFNRLSIKNVTFFNAKSGTELFTVKKITLSYDAKKFFSSEPLSALSALTIYGVDANLDLDDGEQNEVLQKVTQYIQKIRSGGSTGKAPFSIRAIRLKKIKVNVKKDQNDYSVTLSSVNLKKDSSDFFAAKISGSFYIDSENESLVMLKSGAFQDVLSEYFDTLSGKFVISGLLADDFTQSSFRLTLKNSGSTLVKFSSLHLFGEYTQDMLRMYSISPFMPFKMIARVSNPLDKISVDCSFEKGKILSGLTFRRRSTNALYKLRDTIFSGDAFLEYSVKDKTLDYKAFGETIFAQSYVQFAGSDLAIAFDFEGDLNTVNIKKMAVDSKKINFASSLNVDFDTQKVLGTANLNHWLLPSGEAASGEMRFVDEGKGFALLMPELYFGEQKLSDIAVNFSPKKGGIDFTSTIYDYSHETPEPDEVPELDSELAPDSTADDAEATIANSIAVTGYVDYAPVFKARANIKTDSMHTGSIANIAKTFLTQQTRNAFTAVANEKNTQNRLLTADIDLAAGNNYFNYDAKNITILNTSNVDESFMLKLHGNASALTVSQIEILYKRHFMQGAMDAKFISKGNVDFSSNFLIDSNSYNFNGRFVKNRSIIVSGNYSTLFELDFAPNSGASGGNWEGSFTTAALPIPIAENFSYLTCNSSFERSEKTGFEAVINSFEWVLVNSISNPSVSFNAAIKNGETKITNLLFKDSVSTLRGTGECALRNIVEGDIFSGLETIYFTLQMRSGNGASAESYYLQAFIENAQRLPFSFAAFKDSFSIEAAMHAYNVPSSHFMLNQQKEDKSTAHASFSGTVSNPHITLNIESVMFKMQTMQVGAKGTVLFDNKIVISRKSEITLGNHTFSDIYVDFSLHNFSGNSKMLYRFDMPENNAKKGKKRSKNAGYIEMPVAIEIKSGTVNQSGAFFALPQEFAAAISSTGITTQTAGKRGTSVSTGFDFRIVRKYNEGFVFFTAKTASVNGWILESGVFSLTLSGLSPIQCKADGIIRQEKLNVNIKNIYVDVSKMSPFLYFPYFAVYKGVVTGDFQITGTMKEPIFSGELLGSGADFNSPNYVPEHFFSQTDFVAVIEKSQLTITEAPFFTKNDVFFFTMELSFTDWAFENIDLQFFIPSNSSFAATINWADMHINARASGSFAINYRKYFTTITGDLFCKDGTAEMLAIKDSAYSESTDDISVSLTVTLGQKIQLRYNPFLRVLAAPNTVVRITVDTAAQIAEIVGSVQFRGGEVVWLGRNFYVREGSLVFDNYQGVIDPRITVRAETKERDTSGERVQIILSVQNQFLSEFMPVYSASPPKSEMEIMQILGQIGVGDSIAISDAVAGSADFMTQIFLTRRFEDGLRDFLKLDILSLRMMVVQNALKRAFDPSSDTLTAGKFFDNTSLYLGKYLGSSIYADVLMNFAYDDTAAARSTPENNVSDLNFQPEIGLEMLAPFATIRWAIAPDMFDDEASWMNAASLTLSWKFDLK